MPLSRIRRLLADGGAKPLSSDHCLWELSSPWWPFWRRARRFESLEVEILDAAATLPGVLHLVAPENPQDYDVGGTWSHAHQDTYRVPDDCDLGLLQERVLVMGNWSLYSSYEAIDPAAIPDSFRVASAQVATFAAAHGVPLFVQAFSGNDPWRLWVQEVLTPQELAA